MRSPKKKKRKVLRSILREHLGKNLPFVLYKKPGSNRLMAMLQSDRTLGGDLDFSKPGFVMAPFQQGETPLVILQPDRVYWSKFKPAEVTHGTVQPIENPIGREIHTSMVAKATDFIKNGAFKKVVLSRRFSVSMKEDVVRLAFKMFQAYPQAFGYLFHHPETGTWMGATPELLLRSEAGIGETIALAGTRSTDPTVKENQWTSKETYEQQVVTDYIVQQMKDLGLDPEIGSVENIQAGKLWHLGTSVRTKLPSHQAKPLLGRLHPTPAVCGYPAKEASSYIASHENYSREYYTGFLGEIGIEARNRFEIFVNLRCLQIRNGRAYIYVGGGITADSDPDSEWVETQQKSATMLSLFENSPKPIG